MNRVLTGLAAGAMLLAVTGCSGSGEADGEEAAEPSSSASTSETSSVRTATVRDTCQKVLTGPIEGNGEFVKLTRIMTTAYNDETLSAADAAQAKKSADAMADAAEKVADQYVRDALQGVVDATRALLAEDDLSAWDITDFKTAAQDSIDLCEHEFDTSYETPTAGATPSTAPAGVVMQWSCYTRSNDPVAFVRYQDAWDTKGLLCDSASPVGELDRREQKATRVAGDPGSLETLGVLYDICAESGASGDLTVRSSSQAREARATLIACPDHPFRTTIEKRIDRAINEERLIKAGRIFNDGTFRVGKDVPAGTYEAKPDGEGCYWERTDRNGNIIDNQYTNGLRTEMTVQASDYSITVRGCGEWRPV